jgi:hypothetical protein
MLEGPGSGTPEERQKARKFLDGLSEQDADRLKKRINSRTRDPIEQESLLIKYLNCSPIGSSCWN